MPRTRRDLAISLLLLALSLAALAWFFLRTPGFTQPDQPHMAWFVGGALGTLIFLPVSLNFLYAHRLVTRLAAGHGTVARWTIPAQAVQDYQRLDAGTKPPNAWRPSLGEQRSGVEVIFGEEILILGRQLIPIPSAGLQSLQGIAFQSDPALVLVLAIQARMPGDSSLNQSTLWRIPVIDPQAANAALRHFQATLSGEKIIAPNRWRWRYRLGIALAVILPCLGLYGWHLTGDPARTSEAQMILPITFIMLGFLGTPGALIIALSSRSFLNRQRGRK